MAEQRASDSQRVVAPQAVIEPATLVKAIRAAMGITQMELASLMKIQLITVQRWERRISTPRPRHWRRLCQLAETARVPLTK